MSTSSCVPYPKNVLFKEERSRQEYVNGKKESTIGTFTRPISRTTTPWKFPRTNIATSGGDGLVPFLLRPFPRSPSADEDRRRAGGSPGRSSTVESIVAPNTSIVAAFTVIVELGSQFGRVSQNKILPAGRDWKSQRKREKGN